MYSYPRYGLRNGFASATGNFQRLRGRPPLVSPLKSCMGRSFTAVTRVQIPSGTPNNLKSLRGSAVFAAGTKRHNFIANVLAWFAQSPVFSGIRSHFARHKKAHNSARSWNRNSRSAKQANDLTLSSSFMNCDRLSVRIQCHSAGSMTKQFLHYLDICFSCP